MSLLDELKRYFPFRNEVATKEEIAEVVAEGIYKGEAETDTDPGSPVNPCWYGATPGVTYTYFLDENGEAITVPTSTGEGENKKYVVGARLSFNGTFWEAKWSLADKPDLSEDYVPNSAKGTEIATLVDGKVPENQAPFTSSGNNKLDVSKIESGRFASDTGAPVAADNWCRLSNFPCAGGQKISLLGTGVPIVSNNIFFFKNAAGEILSMQTGPTGTAPANTVSVDITLLNVTGVGLDPNNPSFYTDVMLNYGDPIPFEPFKVSLDAGRVAGTPPDAQAQIDVISENLDKILDEYDIFYRFNGSTSKVVLPVLYLFKNDGDYIEFKARWTGDTYTEGLGLLGSGTNISSNILGYYDNDSIYLRELITSGGSTPPYKEFNGLPDLINVWRIIRIDITGGYYVMKVDGVQYATNPVTNGININSIGGAYSINAKFDIEYFKLKVSEKDLLEIRDFKNTLGSTDVEAVLESKSKSGASYMYYEFDVLDGLFKVYTKMPNSDGYVGFWIKHEIDMSDIVYKDVWRIYQALIYNYSGGKMVQTSKKALITGENECVYRTPDKVDFTGGYHGDETVIDVTFVADDLEISTDNDIALTACNAFSYVENSNMHRTASGTPEAPVFDPDHTIEALHFKETNIRSGGYDTHNILTWQDSITIALWYHGISCVGKDFGEFVRNEYGESVVMVGDALEKLSHNGARMYFAENISNGLKASVSSILKQPLSNDSLCRMFIWDRPSADNKYYRKTPDNINVTSNEVWESNMSVRFDCL